MGKVTEVLVDSVVIMTVDVRRIWEVLVVEEGIEDW